MSTEDVRDDQKKKGIGGKFSSLRKKKKGAKAEDDLGPASPRDAPPDDDIPAGALASELAGIGKYNFFSLEINLKEGINLAAKDKTDSYTVSFEHESVHTATEEGTSDPYVKVKSDGKQVYKSKTIPKTLNPKWDEKFFVAIEDVSCPIVLKVYDSDKVGNDDFMGKATVDLAGMEVNKANNMKLDLEGGEKLGQISVSFNISPRGRKETEDKRPKTGPREPKVAGKDQMWDGLVSITLVEGAKLIPMDDTGFSDPYCRFRLGNEKYKSKACKETLSPYWKEQFDMKFWDDTPMMLEVTVWDKDIRKDEFMGRCQIDLEKLAREKSHKIVAELEDNAGTITMHVAITALDAPGCESDLNSYVEEPNRKSLLVKSFGLKNTGKKMKEVGWLLVKYHRAVGLASADIGGASDPFTVIELNNQRLVTPTIYKTLNPQYEKVYEMNVHDIHDTLDFTIYDEDKRGEPEFLGKVCIPLLTISNGEKRLYQLKDKTLEKRAKGHLILTLEVLFNPIRAGIRTINPRDPKVLFEPPKFKRALLQRNIDRVKKLGESVASTGAFIQSLFTWQYKFRSAFGFMIYIMLVLNFDFYLIPLSLLLTFLKQYVVCMMLQDRNVNPEEQEGAPVDDDDDDDDDEEPAKGKKGEKGQSFKEKMAALTGICQTVQNALDVVASQGERVKNTFNWTVPFCSYMMCVAMTAGTVVLYLVPLKFLLLAWGINKFTKKIRKPNAVDNNEAADFLSRIPSDIEVKQYKLLKTDPALRVKRIDG